MRGKLFSLREARENSGISVDILAALLGISAKRYNTFEHFPDWVDVPAAKRISLLISTPVEEIFFGRSSTISRIYRRQEGKNGEN
ncbi:MAG: hypothetical protein GX098_12400 [Bacteroidales bacterium]|nr:hypothetical protein [Bacteroidales bacterium]